MYLILLSNNYQGNNYICVFQSLKLELISCTKILTQSRNSSAVIKQRYFISTFMNSMRVPSVLSQINQLHTKTFYLTSLYYYLESTLISLLPSFVTTIKSATCTSNLTPVPVIAQIQFNSIQFLFINVLAQEQKYQLQSQYNDTNNTQT